MNKLAELARCRGEHCIGIKLFPARTRAIAVLSTIVVTFVVQPPTPAEAAALWAQSTHNTAGHSNQGALNTNIDPPYNAPAKRGTNYVAPVAKNATTRSKSELMNLRTRSSRTFSDGSRQLTTLVYAESVNYRDTRGTWRAV